ncbi:hypothetical protein N658DRAFT_415106 [Parathielavia hyrcaniae]|uniref:Uncharacterized protein n=1 Tax=Parathielavia hyrcaniae TaxID=113614 RepID=A0AAN6T6F2_9PEZI|nr:hypothetical protein N658DRAFT_415106 [Parathielavia hyrcaniae]
MADEFCLNLLSGDGDKIDDTDSLFGGDDDTELTSLFTEVGAIEPSLEHDYEPTSPSPQERPPWATNPAAAQLEFPEVPAQAHPNHQHALSMPLLHLPAVPDPPGASLSHHDGHTSGDLVVSTQDFTHITLGSGPAVASFEGFPDNAALDAELERLWDFITSDEQPVNAQAESRDSDATPEIQDDNIILPAQIPGFRYAYSNTNITMRLPRRIDQDQKEAEELMYFVTLNRNTKMETLYEHLELDLGLGKLLALEMKKLLKEPPLIELVKRSVAAVSETKKNLVSIAWYMLVVKDLGTTWFGDGCRTAATRTLLWPRDSSILFASFVMLLYRIYINKRQMHQATLRTQARLQQSGVASERTLSPSPSRSPSASPARAPQSPPPTPKSQAFFKALANDAIARKKRKHAEAAYGVSRNPYEVDIPANAKLKYRVYVRDKTDGSDLVAPTTYRHTDFMISRGAFSSLKASFEAAGQVPTFEIQTPLGRKGITSEEQWEQAVLSIYNTRRSGGVVEVDIFV